MNVVIANTNSKSIMRWTYHEPVIMMLLMLLWVRVSMADVDCGLSLFCSTSRPSSSRSLSRLPRSIFSILWYFSFAPRSLVASARTRKPLKAYCKSTSLNVQCKTFISRAGELIVPFTFSRPFVFCLNYFLDNIKFALG